MELDGLLSTVMLSPAVTLTFDFFYLISVSQARIHSCGEITSNSYKDLVFTRFFVSLPVVTLTFDRLIPKANQHMYEPVYNCDPNWFLLCELC